MATEQKSTWLVTGASSGLGKAIAMEALQNGHKVIGTTRDEQQAKHSFPEFQSNGGIWLLLDPGKEEAFAKMVEFSKKHAIDVLVNNAGYAFIGGVEDTRYEKCLTKRKI